MRDDSHSMRTTLDIDDDVLRAAKEIAAARETSAGRVISDLVRSALEPKHAKRVRNGVPLMPRRRKGSPRPTMDLVNALRDEP
jgi:hypothetical protein